jgi:hypothetical protein
MRAVNRTSTFLRGEHRQPLPASHLPAWLSEIRSLICNENKQLSIDLNRILVPVWKENFSDVNITENCTVTSVK